MSLKQFLLILKARVWVLLLTLGLVVSAVLGVSVLLPKEYTATTSLVVEAKASDPLLGGMLPAQMIPGYLATQVDIIRSDRVARRVVSMLKLTDSPAVQEDWQNDTDGVGSITVWLADLLKKKLDVIPSRDSNVLNISYSGVEPMFAAAIANAWAQAYVDTSLELRVEPARQYAKWFDSQNAELRSDLEAAQKRLSDYQQTQGIVATDERMDVESSRLAELSSQLSAIQAQLVDSESRRAQSRNADSLPEVMQNGLIQSLRADLARQEAMRGQLAGRYGANHPEIARVDAEITSLREKIGAETQRVVRALGTTTRVDALRESEIQSALDAQKKRVLALKAERDQINVLLRDVENAQRAYDMVTQRLAQTNLESQTQHTNIVVLTQATPPFKPSRPNLLVNGALAVVFGLILGLVNVLALERFRPRIRGVEDMVFPGCGPVLGVIPTASRTRNAT